MAGQGGVAARWPPDCRLCPTEQEPLSAHSAIIRLDASDPDLAVWRNRDIAGDPPREAGPIEVGPSSPSVNCGRINAVPDSLIPTESARRARRPVRNSSTQTYCPGTRSQSSAPP